ncbi:MAG TPA: F0F1 ATP synthase subunit A [Candidatus Limnocylindria bacterium]|nr:F0F1 ATP synthase subunit A [Candidatus Limnocylindria bacterium]
MPEEEHAESLVHVAIKAEELVEIGPFTVTNSMVGTLIATIVLLAAAWWVSRNAQTVPSRLQSVIEFPVEFMANIVQGQGGHRWRSIVPLILTIFLLVLTANWVGLLPGVGTIGVNWTDAEGHTAVHPLIRPASADLNFTLALAMVAFVAFIAWGIKANGVRGYLKETFVANPAYMTPIMTPIHVVSELSRLISLSMRLFGNVFAGEVLLAVMLALTFVVVPAIFLGLEMVFGFVQALVFALLTLTYITLAMAGHGGGHDEEHDEPHGDADDAGLSEQYATAGANRP